MSKFSSRFGFDPRIPKEPVLEDAPEWVRTRYCNEILEPLCYIDMDTRQSNDEMRPLGIKKLYEDFCIITRQDTDSEAFDSWHCWDYLKSVLRSTDWLSFYDFIEIVGQQIKNIDEEDLWYRADDWRSKFGFENYRQKLNGVFSEERIGWRLNDKSLLVREIPSTLEKKISANFSLLQDELAPARKHYLKAVRYMLERGEIDPENVIKEITSAVESVGRVYYPGAKTLGDVAGKMKKTNSVPPMLVSLIEKYYGYASSEPAIRHGAPIASRVTLPDAEFCLHVGTALIRYIVETHRARNNSSKTLKQPDGS